MKPFVMTADDDEQIVVPSRLNRDTHSPGYWKNYRERRRAAGRPLPDYHKGDNKNRHTFKNKFERAHFVAWDGEGITLEDGSHKYTLLANSEGGILRNPDGITSMQAFHFLCDWGKLFPQSIHVFFAGGYDFNMMLGDIPKQQLLPLWRSGQTTWEGFVIRYTPSKFFNIKRHDPEQWFKDGKANFDAHIQCWDVFGFFQTSFVMALEKWLPGEVPELETIKAMKKRRSDFTQEDQDEVERYNQLELSYLRRMCEKLRDAHVEAKIVLRDWNGAGATAGSLLRFHSVADYVAPLPSDVQRAAQFAYSGGRIEAIKMGNAEHLSGYQYDINSAYPSKMPYLPCLVHGKWIRSDGPPLSEFSLGYIKWDFPKERPFYPWFYRTHDGSILYPRSGEGWYWYPELFLDPHGVIQESWSYVTDCKCKPFGWVEGTYKFRLQLKREGSAAEKAVKLGLNALYGKFAQQAGYTRSHKIPRYHSIAWAGYLTSATRAQLYRAAIQHPNSVVMFATDAFISDQPHKVTISENLGDWTAEEIEGLTVVQAGVYWTKKKGKWAEKYRGFDAESLSREGIVKAWANKQDYAATLTRFIGLGSALSGESYWTKWRTWNTQPRSLKITPTGKRIPLKASEDFSVGLKLTKAAFNWTPDTCSALYRIEWENTDENQERFIGGVPFHIVEEEQESSWAM